MSDDLPTLDLPVNAISGCRVRGSWRRSPTVAACLARLVRVGGIGGVFRRGVLSALREQKKTQPSGLFPLFIFTMVFNRRHRIL